ncbi:MAG: carboxypeptidase-like regulatory domain-containing protein [Planctomycetota bacterium]|nr:carboxypeptidase-like regulatory domain-containing protein [Planctomycetota bacterium]
MRLGLSCFALALALGACGGSGAEPAEPEAASPDAAAPQEDAPSVPTRAPAADSRRAATSEPTASAPRVDDTVTASLEVEVRWSDSGLPAVNVGVRAYLLDSLAPHAFWREFRTDAGGVATLRDVPVGRLRIEGDRSGSVEFTLAAASSQRARLELAPGRLMRGRAVDTEGKPVANAELWILRQGQRDGQKVGEADAMGTFQLAGAAEGTRLYARHRDRSPSVPYAVPSPGAANVEIRLSLGLSGGLVLGQVVDREDRAIAGAAVALEPRTIAAGEPAPRATLVTGADGRFQFDGAEPSLSRLMVMHPDFAHFHEELPVVPGTRTERIVRLVAGVRVAGAVRKSDSSPASGVEIVVHGPAEWLELRTLTGKGGEFTLRGVGSGPLRARIGEFESSTLVPAGLTHAWNPILR